MPGTGSAVRIGHPVITSSPRLGTSPGPATLLVAIGANLFGDTQGDALNPRLKR